jgi:hypothetical protein
MGGQGMGPGLFTRPAAASGAGGGGVPGRRGGCRHCHSHIRVSGSQVCASQDGAPHSGRESRERSQV